MQVRPRPIEHPDTQGIVLFEINHPPVNALSQPIRAALLSAIRAAAEDPATQAFVIHGVGRHFVAGADVHEFDRPPLEPLLNDVLLQLEALPFPVIAALHGAVLGGGLELALASHYRCASPDVSLGFPEIKLGLLPGSGGTQRLPRLVGPTAALEMMLTGTSLNFEQARQRGLIDREIADGQVLEGALRYARELIAAGAPRRPLRPRNVSVAGLEPRFFDEQRARLAGEKSPLLAPGYIVECVEAAVTQPFEAGLVLGRRRFEECRVSEPSRALRHLFFAERPKADASLPPPDKVRTAAVIGAGTMGAGIAMSLATSGLHVVLIDPQAAALEKGLSHIRAALDTGISKGRFSALAGAGAWARISSDGALEGAANADLVIEAVFESLAVKQAVFGRLDQICRPEAVLATNTSTLDVDAIASATARPESVLGMHFFSPAQVMRLVEIVRGARTAPAALATAADVTRKMGKLGIVVGNGFGFVGNRMLYAYGRENQFMLLEGATPTEIDAAMSGFGMAMGPNAVGDLAGLDVGYRVRRERKDRPDDPRYYRVADLLVEAGRLGQKTGRGAFRYEAGSRRPLPDPEVEALIVAEAARLAIRRHRIARVEIVERCLLALVNEGARLLTEGIASSAADIDAIWCNGYGFPRVEGGPMWYAGRLGLKTVKTAIERYAAVLGTRDWTPAPLLAELAQQGHTFSDWDRMRASAQSRAGADS